jgi:hypothetical protein
MPIMKAYRLSGSLSLALEIPGVSEMPPSVVNSSTSYPMTEPRTTTRVVAGAAHVGLGCSGL